MDLLFFHTHTGIEVTDDDIYGIREIHINGDISFALRQFWWSAADREKLLDRNASKFVDVAFGLADFWVSRMMYNNSLGQYVINGAFKLFSLCLDPFDLTWCTQW